MGRPLLEEDDVFVAVLGVVVLIGQPVQHPTVFLVLAGRTVRPFYQMAHGICYD